MTTMSDDLISRQAAIDVVKTYLGDYEISRTVQCRLRLLPSAEPERKTGRWILINFPWYLCSECGAIRKNKKFPKKFCSHCGAKMEGDSDEQQDEQQ